jgi:hypothetical protein
MKIYKNSVICVSKLAVQAWDGTVLFAHAVFCYENWEWPGGRTVSYLLEAICEDTSSGMLVEKLTFTPISNGYLCLP